MICAVQTILRHSFAFLQDTRVGDFLAVPSAKSAQHAQNSVSFYPFLMIRFFLNLRALTLVFAAFIPQIIFSQEQLGMRLERYSGIYGAVLNPANTADNPNNWEVSLFTAEAFFDNNYAFLRKTSLQNALRNTDKIVSVADTTRENPPPADAIFLDYAKGTHKMYAVVQSRVTGPGFSFRIGENDVVGLTTAFRSEVSSYKIPEILAYRTISNLPRNQAVNIPAVGITGMAWSEIGLHYSHSNTESDLHTAWGVSPKILLGYEGFYTRARSNFDYTQRQGDTVAFGSANWDYALTLGNVLDSDNAKVRKQGSGLGLDAGFTWAQPADNEADGYDWRLGVSVIDLGYVRFNKNAERHHIAFDTLLTVTDANFPSRDNATDVFRDVSQAFLGDPDASLRAKSFAIGLPTALSAQFDAQLAKNVFITGLLVQRVPLLRYSVKRPNTLAVAPRYEHRWFSVSLPVVLSDWQSLRVGAAARLGWLYVGSDNLGSFFEKNKLSGADFYIGLKINAFSIHFNGGNGLTRESNPHRGKQRMGKIKCYKF